MRAALHYIFSLAVLVFYGGQVCPYIEGLPIGVWLFVISVVFVTAFSLRSAFIRRFVSQYPYELRSRRQFHVEFSLFIAAGLAAIVFNTVNYGFPPLTSGLKVLLGFAVMGLFAGLDLALQRERLNSREMQERGLALLNVEKFFPLTRKFALVASSIVVSMLVVIFLVVSKDMAWMVTLSEDRIAFGQRAVLVEISFIGVVILGSLVNLIFSYAGNLRMFFGRQNAALTDVAEGVLTTSVPVSTNDEFGVMARYTNYMIAELASSLREIRLTQDVTIMTLASVAEIRDNETGRHIMRTQRYVRALAQQLNGHSRFREHLDAKTIEVLFKSAPLHDIGKVGVRDAVLRKPGRLTPEEFEEMKLHPVYGRDALRKAQDMLGTTSFLRLAEEIAYSHHEKWDGSGYPLGLRENDIPISGRLMALADVYDALVFTRVYRKALSHETARGIIVEGRGSHFDPDIVDAFLAVEEQFVAIAREFAEEEGEPAGN